jgi:hypothetical protein
MTFMGPCLEGHYSTRHTVLWSCTHIPNIIDLSRKTKNVMARTRKYYFVMTFMGPCPLTSRSNNCFFRDRSMIFGMWVHVHKAVCRIPVIHPHTKYHWPISRQKCYGPDKKILFKKNIIWPWGQRSRSHTVMTFVGPWPLTWRSNNCFLNSIFLSWP